MVALTHASSSLLHPCVNSFSIIYIFSPHPLNCNRFFFFLTSSYTINTNRSLVSLGHVRAYCEAYPLYIVQKEAWSSPISFYYLTCYRNSRHPTEAPFVLRLDKCKENVPSTEDSTVEIFKKKGKKRPKGDTNPRSHKPQISHPTSFPLLGDKEA